MLPPSVYLLDICYSTRVGIVFFCLRLSACNHLWQYQKERPFGSNECVCCQCCSLHLLLKATFQVIKYFLLSRHKKERERVKKNNFWNVECLCWNGKQHLSAKARMHFPDTAFMSKVTSHTVVISAMMAKFTKLYQLLFSQRLSSDHRAQRQGNHVWMTWTTKSAN